MDRFTHLPIEDISKDMLGFGEKAMNIASFVNNIPPQIPYSVSINGPWGSGKSTMLNLISSQLDRKKCKVVKFNPWMITNHENLVESLFEEIFYALDGWDKQAKELFLQYAKKIIPTLSNTFLQRFIQSQGLDPQLANKIGFGVESVLHEMVKEGSDKPLSVRKDELYKEMGQKSSKDMKVVIMVDELDRLFPDEIITIFRSIKSLLDLPGLVFIVAFDEDAVCDVLQSIGFGNPEHYLTKIFQRKYYVQTNYQIMTLLDNFVWARDGNEGAWDAMDMALQAYVYIKEDRFAVNFEEPNFYDSSLPVDCKIKSVEPKKIIDSYYTIFSSLRENLNLNNPRSFLNFAQYTNDHWPDYYDYVFGKVKLIPRFVHAAFLIFAAYYQHPAYSEHKYFLNNYQLDGEYPEFLKNVRGHLDLILPTFEVLQDITSDGSSAKYVSKKTTTVVETALMHLNKYPDLSRGTQQQE